jgi:hypothetical protein
MNPPHLYTCPKHLIFRFLRPLNECWFLKISLGVVVIVERNGKKFYTSRLGQDHLRLILNLFTKMRLYLGSIWKNKNKNASPNEIFFTILFKNMQIRNRMIKRTSSKLSDAFHWRNPRTISSILVDFIKCRRISMRPFYAQF